MWAGSCPISPSSWVALSRKSAAIARRRPAIVRSKVARDSATHNSACRRRKSLTFMAFCPFDTRPLLVSSTKRRHSSLVPAIVHNLALGMAMRNLACKFPPKLAVRCNERNRSVPEVPRAGEHHGDAVVVGGLDHLVVAHRAARLDHRGGAGLDSHQEAVREWEEGIGGDHRALGQWLGELRLARRVLGLAGRDARRVDPAHLAG